MARREVCIRVCVRVLWNKSRQSNRNSFSFAQVVVKFRASSVQRVKRAKEARREEICQRKTEIMPRRNKNVGPSNTRIRNFVRGRWDLGGSNPRRFSA